MPFTLAHVAAALPLRRLQLIWSALIVGTIAPGLEYFVRLSPDNGYGHTLSGSLLLSLPLAILTLWLFHSFVKAPLIGLLPDGIQRRLADHHGKFQFRGAARFALIVTSILLGIATHLAWDSFTHPNTWLYLNWQVLREPVNGPIFGTVPIYKVLQHGSTIVGLGALLIWLALWYRNAEVHARSESSQDISSARKLLILIVVTASALLGAAIRAVAAIGIPANHLDAKRFAGLLVVTSISIMWWESVLYGVSRTRRQTKTADPSLREG